jgi:uncharacterized protein (TIGR02147 family)
MPICVFDYTDFRKFLRDRYQEKKESLRGFTYQYVAAKAGFRSPGYFSQVLKGSTRLTDRLIPGIARVLGLGKKEAQYFETMVRYNQAATHDEKRHYFAAMLEARPARSGLIRPEQFELFDKWYYAAVRAVISIHPFGGDYQELGKSIVPAISTAEARKAVELLARLGIIVRGPQETWQLSGKHLTTGDTVESVVVNNYMLNTLEISRDALYRFAREERRFAALTISLSTDGYRQIEQEAEKFRKTVLDIVRKDRKTSRAYQLNMQLFPLSKPLRRREEKK